MLNVEILRKAEAMLANSISDELFKDRDPENTEWWHAVWTASKCYRKRRRGFFKLWMDELQKARAQCWPGGMANRYASLSGGSAIANILQQSTTYDG